MNKVLCNKNHYYDADKFGLPALRAGKGFFRTDSADGAARRTACAGRARKGRILESR